jgi:two-component system chemotaxis response regulator CheY
MVMMDRCILVVEDSAEIRRIVAWALREAGHSVIEAEDGVAALQILEGGQADFDLVLTDIRMPRMDGVELGRRIVEGNWQSQCSICRATRGAAGDPPAPLLRKPFSMTLLVDVVDRLLLGSAAAYLTD